MNLKFTKKLGESLSRSFKKLELSINFKEIIKAMGLVFGDIGTSPIYTLTVIFLLTAPTIENTIGVLSLIFWTLIFLVTIKYAWIAMSLSTKGEGGIIVLKGILISSLKKGRRIAFTTFLAFIGISLVMGDGVITPAISILSAVEGMQLIPGVGHIDKVYIITITCIITILLFLFQRKGTDKVAASFGPIMVIWFIALLIFGVIAVFQVPEVFKAINPYYGINFLFNNGLAGFFVLSEVILCATGAEALYTDMGHLGRRPIRQAWSLVLIALIFNYFGQGAYLVQHPHSKEILFEMVRHYAEILYIPFLILTLLATIIASQAMISAVMSLIYQGISTRVFPLMKVKYTSSHIKGQIYIGAVNWTLLIAVLLMILLFQESKNLAAAYGTAVTGSMTISSIFMIQIFKIKKIKLKFIIACFVFLIDLLFLFGVSSKIPHGGFWSLVIAALPLFILQLWSKGNNRMQHSFRSLPVDVFLESYNQIYSAGAKIKGTALFFSKSLQEIPPYMVHCILRGNIIYENNILVSIINLDNPYGFKVERFDEIAKGLTGIVVYTGYMEVINLPKILKDEGITEKVIFYGLEDIITSNIYLKIFSFLKKVTPTFVSYYKLPYNKLHGVITRIEI